MTLTEFLHELSLNNDRPWFQAHKPVYDELRARWIQQVGQLIDYCSEWAPEYAFLDPKACTFRIYRDTRFSPDKTPYKTYISSGLGPRGKDHRRAGFYISAGVNPQDNGIYGGLWAPEAPVLRKIRHAIVDNIEEFEAIMSDPELLRLYPHWCGQTLKTIPKGWPKDHPQAPLLRLLHFGREYMAYPTFFDDPAWPEKAADIMRPLKPLIDFLNYSIEEE